MPSDLHSDMVTCIVKTLLQGPIQAPCIHSGTPDWRVYCSVQESCLTHVLPSFLPFCCLPQTSVWATPWTALKADFTKGPVKDQVKGFVQMGCPALETGMAPVAAVPKCAGLWNRMLTPVQLAQMAKSPQG